ncbi:MAG TPA: hypothetical protein VFH45_02285 [Acidimicrobiales bacterium]|nr:hypothetical protein [Acidimicrobiales bacterium]
MKLLRRLLPVVPVVAGLMAVPTAATAITSAPAQPSSPGPRVDLKVLLLSSGNDTTTQLAAWRTSLDEIGVPYDVFVRSSTSPLTTATLQVDAQHGRYNAVVVTDGTMLSSWSPIPAPELQALAGYERSFGVREIADNAGPAPSFGLDYSGVSGSPSASSLNLSATLTPAGTAVFPYLNPTVKVPYEDGLFAYLAPPASSALLSQWNGWGITDVASFQTLVQGTTVAGGYGTPAAPASLVGIASHADGRQEMVTEVNSAAWTTSDKLLHVGMLNWATRGLYLGYWRNYFSMHFDDVLLPDTRWSTAGHCNPDAAGCSYTTPNIRMTPADVTTAVNWSKTNNLRLDLVFNGQGSDLYATGKGKKGADPLTTALLANTKSFGWISHTWSHEDLDSADLKTIVNEIRDNIDWAHANHVPIDDDELVTGAYTGLTNPLLPQALQKTGVNVIASDASYPQWANVQQLGPATVVPRHPTELAYNVGTRAEQLDEFWTTYRNDPWVAAQLQAAGLAQPDWNFFVNLASNMMLQSILANDARPYYAHQNNLAEEGTFYGVADAMLAKYRSWFSVPLVQPDMTDAGRILTTEAAWQSALKAGAVTAYLQGGKVHILSNRKVMAPVTGANRGDTYGGLRSDWVDVPPSAGGVDIPVG